MSSSLQQPRHRRPSWKASRISHRTYLENTYHRKLNPTIAPDGDTFYYNHAFMAEWSMPMDLWIRLPSSLTTEVQGWQAAGAALLTVLARIDKLDAEGIYRGWPAKTTAHLSRTASSASCGSPRVQSPASPDCFPHEPEVGRPALPSLQTSFTSTLPAIPDTPPFTPQDSIMGEDQLPGEGKGSTFAHLDRLNDHLASHTRRNSEHEVAVIEPSPQATPSSRRSSGQSGAAMPTDSLFDEAAWDVYIKSYQVELDHLRSETLVRFRHVRHQVDKHWTELKNSGQPVLLGASVEFVSWWDKMKEKSDEYEKECQSLELPDPEFVKVERMVQGLPT